MYCLEFDSERIYHQPFVMKAAFKRDGEVFLRDIELPGTGSHDIRIKVAACSICGTDFLTAPDRAGKELQFGHEVAGTVVEKGSAVSGFDVGTTVVVNSSSACGSCDNCTNGRQDLCTDISSPWQYGSFGFAEEMLVPAVLGIAYDGLPSQVACLQEPLGVAIDMVQLAEIAPGANALVVGGGPIGLMAVALAKSAGANRIIVSEYRERAARRELAKQFGADDCIDPDDGPLDSVDFGCSIDRILVTAPPAVLPEAVSLAARGGIISFIGIKYDERRLVTIDANELHFKKLQLRGSFDRPALHGPAALAYLKEGVIDGEALVSHRFPLDDIVRAMQTARNDLSAVKVVVEP